MRAEPLEGPRPTVRVGITGPIGCGKSTVAGRFEALGATVIDADLVAREVTAPGTPGHEAIVERFPEALAGPDGVVDRAALARIVFADAAALRDLEAIVHPRVRPVILERIAVAEDAEAPAVVIEAIRLLEGGLAGLCDLVVLVTCRAEDQQTRLMARGMPAEDASRRIAAQEGLAERVRAAAQPVVIDTTGPLERTERLTDQLWEQLVAAADSQ